MEYANEPNATKGPAKSREGRNQNLRRDNFRATTSSSLINGKGKFKTKPDKSKLLYNVESGG